MKDTPFDFTTPKPIGRDINADNEQIKNGTGFDHCYVLNKHEVGEPEFCCKSLRARLWQNPRDVHHRARRALYTGNFLAGIKGTHGATYPKRSAICLEAQHFPDSPNRPYFPSVVLDPGDRYHQTTIYRFGVKK